MSLPLTNNNEAVLMTYEHCTSYDGGDNGGNAVFLQLQQQEEQVYMGLGTNTNVWGNDIITTFSQGWQRVHEHIHTHFDSLPS